MVLSMCENMPTSQEFTGKMSTDSNRPKSQEGRKSSKPLMEKRRRARINESLCQLKTLILEATNKDSSRHSKLEKADILEMTVKYLKNVQRHQIAATTGSNDNSSSRYRMGYSECINEVSRFFAPMDTNMVDLRLRLLNHLATNCTTTTTNQQQNHPTNVTNSSPSMPSPGVPPTTITSHIPQPLQIQVSPQVSGTTTLHTVPIAVAAPQQTAIAVQSGTNQTASVQQANTAGIARVLSGIQVNGLPGEITVMLTPQTFTNGQLTGHFIPLYSQNAPVLSPMSAATPSSQSLSSPVGTATATIAQLGEREYTVPTSPIQGRIPSQDIPKIVNTQDVSVPVSAGYTSPNSVKMEQMHSQIRHVSSHHQTIHSTTMIAQKYPIHKYMQEHHQEGENVWRPW